MKLSRLPRLVAAFVTIFSLLFTQLAVASYVCPGVATSGVATSGVATSAMVGHPGVDKANPNMCHAHCKMGHQSPDTAQLPQVSPFFPTQLSFVLQDIEVAATSVAPHSIPLPLQRATTPPISIRNCCFRI